MAAEKIGILLFLMLLSACGARNLYRSTQLPNPPMERTFVQVSRPVDPDTGVDPVEFGSAVADDNTVYLASESQGLTAYYRANFGKKWRFSTKGGASSEPLLAPNAATGGETIYFGSNDGFFYALDAEFGRVLWKYETKLPVFAKAMVSNGHIYFMASDDVVYCLDQADGKWVWHYKRSDTGSTSVHGNSSPVLVDGKNVVVGFADGYAVSLNAKNGNLVWEQKIHTGQRFTDVDASAVTEGNTIFMPSYDGGLYALDRGTGKILWRVDAGSAKRVVLDPRDGKSLYVATNNGLILSLNRASGRILWKFELDEGSPTSLVLHDNFLAFGSSVQYFYVIHTGDGSLAYRNNVGTGSGFVAAPFESGQDIFAVSNYGSVYVYRWKKNS